jgi:DNA-binding transcriptional LysR family regulator
MDVIQHMNLAGVDLNLLVVFDALIAERQVTRAAQKVGLSQPAASNALRRLRDLFEDDLFVKTPQGMQPTPKAMALEQPIRQVLAQIQSALVQEAPFIPETSEQVFALGMSDYGEFILLPELMEHLERVAPRIQIQVRSTDRQDALKLLDADEIALAIGFFPKHSSWHHAQELFQERFVCVARQSNPNIKDPFTLEDYLAASHLLVSPREDRTGRVDLFLAQQNLQRHIALTVPHFLVAPFVLSNTNLIATLAERVVRTYAEALALKVSPLPFELSGFSVSMLWHTKNSNDPAHLWLRRTMAELNLD